MGTTDLTELTPELLDDFYAECEEHLNAIRQSLVALEQGPEKARASSLIEHLFRSFHSLKGIAAMAGVGPAEQLTHRTEDYLRELLRGTVRLTPEGVDLLANALQGVEQSIAAFRQGQPLPDVRGIADQFASLLPDAAAAEEEPAPPSAPAEDAFQRKLDEARTKGFFVWKATFVPSPELNQRGVNVSAIRTRLSALGEIIYASPKIGAGGGVAFEFFLSLRETPPDLSPWSEDAVAFEQIAEPSSIPAAVAPAPPALTLAAVAPSQVIRVELERLDELMRLTGELVIQRARLEEQISRLADENVNVCGLQEVNHGFASHFRELRETVMRLRMVPIAEIFDRMPFVVRDLTRGSRKKVRLDIRGQHTELDKFVVERLKDPLLHLVRNAVSHGMEDTEERVAGGKPAEATLTLLASTSGETVIIEMADDGRGIDPGEIVARARELGIPAPDVLDETAILDLISMPGFSTRREADRAAGRGVGMSVVADALRELGGTLFLQTEAGAGTRFVLNLPVTLLITDALIVSSGDQRFAVPQNSVEEVVQIEEKNVKRMEGAELLSFRGAVLPLVRLRAAFGFPSGSNPSSPVLVSQTDRGKIGLVVDRIVGQRQIVVRPLRDPLIQVAGVIGATELGDGRPLLILDAAALAKQNGAKRRAVLSRAETWPQEREEL
jgi:two-component system, chemotaxis family, sensor kinase CheA